MTLYQHAKNQTISTFSFSDIVDLKSCNLISQENFGHMPGTKFFPNAGFAQEYSK